jgi:DNA-binding NarL/FixJ family response regulator
MSHNIDLGATSTPMDELPFAIPVQVLLIDGSSHDLPLLRNASKWDSLGPFQITRKRTLSEGMVALQSALFRIVIVDLSVSTLPRIESLTEVLEVARGLPVIVLANDGAMTNLSEAMLLGAQDYLLRGRESDFLLHTLKHAIERQSLITALDDERESIARESHELRNALACINQFGTILLDGLGGPISEEQREYIGIMLQNASRVRIVVENLRDSVRDGTDELMEQANSTIGVN